MICRVLSIYFFKSRWYSCQQIFRSNLILKDAAFSDSLNVNIGLFMGIDDEKRFSMIPVNTRCLLLVAVLVNIIGEVAG